VLQELKRADRGAGLQTFSKLYPMEFAPRKQLESGSPEKAAWMLLAELQARRARAGSGLFWPMTASS
jgi:hypothetical protein